MIAWTLDGYFDSKLLGPYAYSLVGLLHALNESKCLGSVSGRFTQIVGVGRKRNNVGGRPRTNSAKEALVLRLRREGCSYRSVRDQTGLSLSTIRRIILDN